MMKGLLAGWGGSESTVGRILVFPPVISMTTYSSIFWLTTMSATIGQTLCILNKGNPFQIKAEFYPSRGGGGQVLKGK